MHTSGAVVCETGASHVVSTTASAIFIKCQADKATKDVLLSDCDLIGDKLASSGNTVIVYGSNDASPGELKIHASEWSECASSGKGLQN